jgi:hypothetical protein
VAVPQGITHTPKQLHVEKENGKLYWFDREGMRVMRANCDGSQVETLVETGHGDKDAQDQGRWCVEITVDPKLGKIYWTQKGSDNGEQGHILRASIELPKGESPANFFKQKLYGRLDELLPPASMPKSDRAPSRSWRQSGTRFSHSQARR